MNFVRMRINIEAVNELIKNNFRNNKKWFSEEIGVDYSYLNQILNHKSIDHSPKIINGIMKYCERNKIDAKQYIFLG